VRPTLVCLPGFLGDRRVFEPFAELARARFEVVTLDLPAGSPHEAALALPAVDGHYLTGSFGGLVASCLPPDRLRSLAMVATLPAASLIPRSVRLQSRLLGRLPAPLLEPLYRRHSARSLEQDGVRLHSEGLDAATLRSRLKGVLEHDFVFPSVPLLWVLGATDPQAPSSGEVLRHQPRAEVCHVPGGHRPYGSHPGPLLTELERWWSSLG
jgi:pimeloyl-ACP methyl ester carboxylesterase